MLISIMKYKLTLLCNFKIFEIKILIFVLKKIITSRNLRNKYTLCIGAKIFNFEMNRIYKY